MRLCQNSDTASKTKNEEIFIESKIFTTFASLKQNSNTNTLKKLTMKKILILLTIIVLSSTLSAYNFVKDNFYYDIDTITKTASVVDYDDSNENVLGIVDIQREILYNGNVYKITSIGDDAFDFCHNIKSINIPKEITKIGNGAFYCCSNLVQIHHSCELTSLGEGAFDETLWLNNQPDGCVYFGNHLYKYKGKMPENTSIEVADGTISICHHAFENCKNLVNITLPNSLQLINKYAFNLSGITSISIPNSVDSIAILAFNGCNSLTKVELSSSLKILKYSVFSYCDKLDSIDLSHVTNIEGGAFSHCSSLKSVIFGNSLTIIDKYAFLSCKNLEKVIFPASLDSIGESAFYSCSGIKYMEVQAMIPPRIHEITFDSVSREIEFVVPTEAHEAYASHKYWKEFIGEKNPTFNEYITNNTQNIYYDLQDKTLYFNINNPTEINIYDIMGRLIIKEPIEQPTKQFPLNLNHGKLANTNEDLNLSPLP